MPDLLTEASENWMEDEFTNREVMKNTEKTGNVKLWLEAVHSKT